MAVELRTGKTQDADQILEVMSKAFKRDESDPRYAGLKAMARRCADEYQVLALDGRVIAVVHVHDHKLRVGSCFVRKGDVGHVSVHPDFQAGGYGTKLMAHCVDWLRAEGYHISRLGGFSVFYSRFGWEHFPRRYYEFIIEEVKAGTRLLSPEELLRIPDDCPAKVRPYDSVQDGLACWEVSERFNAGRSGSMPRGKPSAPAADAKPSEPNPLHIVYERGGKVRGYAHATEFPGDMTPFEAKVTIGDFAYDLDEPLAAGLLIKRLLLTAHERGAQRVSARIPFDLRTVAAIREAGINVILKELHASLATNMIQVIDLAGTLEQIKPELEARLKSSMFAKWRGAFAFDVRGQKASVAIDRGKVSVTDKAAPGAQLELGHADMVYLLFGIKAVEELPAVLGGDLRHEARLALHTLFPPQPAASGPWG